MIFSHLSGNPAGGFFCFYTPTETEMAKVIDAYYVCHDGMSNHHGNTILVIGGERIGLLEFHLVCKEAQIRSTDYMAAIKIELNGDQFDAALLKYGRLKK